MNTDNQITLKNYLQRQDVRDFLSVPSEVAPWTQCSDTVAENFKMLNQASEWIYYVLRGHIQMMHYSGDTDGVIPTYGTKRWIEGLQWPVKTPWAQWKKKDAVNGDQVAGFVQRYDGLDFVTIKGTGHMAPQWKREEMQLMISAWIHGEDISLVG